VIENWRRHYNTIRPHSSLDSAAGTGGAGLASRKTGSADAGSKPTFKRTTSWGPGQPKSATEEG